MGEAAKTDRLAVLIDGENVGAGHARAIFDEIATLGEAIARHLHGDFSSESLKPWRALVQPLSLVAQQQFNHIAGKNAADIALVIDAMDLLHRGGLDGFCLVTSDSDFTRLAQRLREGGAKVYGFGAKKTPEAFRNACTRFFTIEGLAAPPVGEGRNAAVPVSGQTASPKDAVAFIHKAMEKAPSDKGWVNLSAVGSCLKQLFSHKPGKFGHAKWVTVVEKSGQFQIERPKTGGVRIKRK